VRTPVDVILDSTAASLRAEIYLNDFCDGFDPVPSGDFRDVAAPAPRVLIACDKFKGMAPALRLSAHPYLTAPRHNQLSVSTLSFPPPPAPSRIDLGCCCRRRRLLCSRQFAATMLLHRHLPNCRRWCAFNSRRQTDSNHPSSHMFVTRPTTRLRLFQERAPSRLLLRL
jgi:hypothetical protein